MYPRIPKITVARSNRSVNTSIVVMRSPPFGGNNLFHVPADAHIIPRAAPCQFAALERLLLFRGRPELPWPCSLVHLRELRCNIVRDAALLLLDAVAVLIVGELVLRQDIDLRAGALKITAHDRLLDAVPDARALAQTRGGIGDFDGSAVGCDSLARKGAETLVKKRKSGTGTVRQRSDGRWEGRVVIGYDDSGLPKTKNVLAKTKRECQEKLRQLTESMVGRNDRKVKSDMLFGDWLCCWYETHSKPTLRASTQNNYENVIHNHHCYC